MSKRSQGSRTAGAPWALLTWYFTWSRECCLGTHGRILMDRGSPLLRIKRTEGQGWPWDPLSAARPLSRYRFPWKAMEVRSDVKRKVNSECHWVIRVLYEYAISVKLKLVNIYFGNPMLYKILLSRFQLPCLLDRVITITIFFWKNVVYLILHSINSIIDN